MTSREKLEHWIHEVDRLLDVREGYGDTHFNAEPADHVPADEWPFDPAA